MELKFKVEPVFIQKVCDKCGAGYMIYTGNYLEGKSPAETSFHHQCSNDICQIVAYYRGIQYPQMRQIVDPAGAPENIKKINFDEHKIETPPETNKIINIKN
jgi:hypothetical protein